ncbi:Uncharacterised protein [uncultured archaeon]|nr:Uncharacterised protein [uncultured archaeon]
MAEKEIANYTDKDIRLIEPDSLDFPLLPMIARTGAMLVFGINPGGDSLNVFGGYLFGSTAVDVVELVYRTYFKDEMGVLDGKKKRGSPYSCFEKHILYDIPKHALKKTHLLEPLEETYRKISANELVKSSKRIMHGAGNVVLKASYPILGALPERWQGEIEKRFDYNKRLATQLSGISEMLGGFVAATYVAQESNSMLAGDIIVMLGWLDGAYRYIKSHSHGEDYKTCGIFPIDVKEIYRDIRSTMKMEREKNK